MILYDSFMISNGIILKKEKLCTDPMKRVFGRIDRMFLYRPNYDLAAHIT